MLHDKLDNLVVNGKNSKTIVCPCCPSVILKAHIAEISNVEFYLPCISKNEDGYKDELMNEFWIVDNIYLFENVGFSKNVGSTKYILCAECEVGPLGLHDINTKKSYIALKRVLYK